jgi:hypothetical protein
MTAATTTMVVMTEMTVMTKKNKNKVLELEVCVIVT